MMIRWIPCQEYINTVTIFAAMALARSTFIRSHIISFLPIYDCPAMAQFSFRQDTRVCPSCPSKASWRCKIWFQVLMMYIHMHPIWHVNISEARNQRGMAASSHNSPSLSPASLFPLQILRPPRDLVRVPLTFGATCICAGGGYPTAARCWNRENATFSSLRRNWSQYPKLVKITFETG